jgi:hypothetical protein
MRTVSAVLFACVLPSLGCGKTAGSTAGDGSSTTTSPATVDASACTPAKLGIPDAKPLAIWKAPEGCERKGGSGMVTIKNEEELRAHFDCKGAPTGIDFARQSLVVAYRTMSPAAAGNDVLDDGQKVTIVNKFRSPCPSDPQPMPVPYTLSFLVPASAPRTFGETSCNVVWKCP